jgi:hypothetical protein
MDRESHPKNANAEWSPVSFSTRRILLGILAIAAAAILLLIGIRYAFL